MKHSSYRGSGWTDRTLDFESPKDFAEYAKSQGAREGTDRRTGRMVISTEKGSATLPDDSLLSYSQKQSIIEKFMIIGIPFILLVALVVVPFLAR